LTTVLVFSTAATFTGTALADAGASAAMTLAPSMALSTRVAMLKL